MPRASEDTPTWQFARARNGRIQWSSNLDFVSWFRRAGARWTNQELRRLLAKSLGTMPSMTTVQKMRESLSVPQTPETRQRAQDERAHCGPAVHALRLLGPEDREHFVRVTGDALVTSDWHIPHHSQPLLDRLLAVAERLGIRQLVINGDFLNQDAFSRWRYHPFNVGWKVEKAAARHVLDALDRAFDRIFYILDNHDRRIIAAHERGGTEFDESDLLDLLVQGTVRGKIRASIYYHWLTINETWRVTSPRDYRRQRLALSNRLAQVYHANVIVGGDHQFGLGVDDSARYVIASNMCMVNPREVPYINTSDSTFPHWQPGFYAIVNNVLYPFPFRDDLWPTWWEHIDATAWRHAPVRAARGQRHRRR